MYKIIIMKLHYGSYFKAQLLGYFWNKKKHIFDFCAMVIGYRSVNIIQVAFNT